jgi:putative transposase
LEVRVKKKRFTEEQIAYALAQESTGQTIAEICRKLGVSEQTFYRWKKKFGSMGVAEVRRLKQLENENTKLKRLVADLSLTRRSCRTSYEKKSDSRPAPQAGRVLAGCLPGNGASGMPRAVRFARDDSLRVVKQGQEDLRMRIKEIAAVRPSWGSPRIHVLLRREGWLVNHKRTERLYRL